jgi:alpha-glucoside transport system permease protein
MTTVASSLPGRGRRGGRLRPNLGSLAFLAPAGLWLALIVLYPAIATVRYSLFNESDTKWVGLDNYKEVFSTASILTDFRNNAIWVIVFPFFVTVIGMILAVLTERIRWSTAFKTIIVMPVVFSATTSGLVWQTIFDIDPHVGVVNAALQTVSDWFHSPGAYPLDSASGQTVKNLAATNVRAGPGGTLVSISTVSPGGVVKLGLLGISPDTPALLHAGHAALPSASAGDINGLVWRDFSPSHPSDKTSVFSDEDGLPDMHLSLLGAGGKTVATATSAPNGQFQFTGVPKGSYHVQLDSGNFTAGYSGTFWLGTQSLTPTSRLSQTAQALLSVPLVDIAMIIAYIWIWAGFAMIIIGAGLASLNHEVLEAARIDGAKEWQVFRKVTVPMLTPVLVVVFVTMVINVLKVFDIILNMAPGSSQQDASTLALDVYNQGFTGGLHTGLASAIAVILFILVVPAMLFNLKRIK